MKVWLDARRIKPGETTVNNHNAKRISAKLEIF